MQPSSPTTLHHHVNRAPSPPSLDVTSTSSPCSSPDSTSSRSDVSTVKAKGKARAIDPLGSFPSPPSGTATEGKATQQEKGADEGEEEETEEWCLICHSAPISDRTVLPRCLHSQFCFGCILRWIAVKRRCPLCQSEIGEYVIHDIREAQGDYVRYHLPPPPLTSSSSATSGGHFASASSFSRSEVVSSVQRARAQRRSVRTRTDAIAETSSSIHHAWQRSLDLRKEVYRSGWYAKHVGSNRHTGYRATPTPAQIRHSLATGGDLGARITTFVRRELHVWPHLDIEFLTQYIVSLLRMLDVSADETVKLLGEFLGEQTARHLLHELECWLRSGKRELRHYDASPFLQYRVCCRTDSRDSERIASQDHVPRERGHHEGSSRARADSTAAQRKYDAQRRAMLLNRLEHEKSLLFAGGGGASYPS